MSTARHSPRFPRVSVYMVVPRSLPPWPLPRRRSLLSLSFPSFLLIVSLLCFPRPLSPSIFLPPFDLFFLSLSLFCPVSAHRPRAHPPRLSGKPCCEPLTVTKVPTYKRGLIPACGNSREHGHGNVRQVPRHVHRENCEVKPSAVLTSASFQMRRYDEKDTPDLILVHCTAFPAPTRS